MIASVNLNHRLRHFAAFDRETSTFLIDGDKLTNSDTGFYTIDVSALFTNFTHTENLIDRFRLEVRPR